ncbi:DUF262 domain-containing protein [Algoriphagus marinus]|uniref:DUF262 domain-containing protein n=1 Tax=Algoriphagus marinus TaxID=1925762 RepID=UPI00094BC169|nr:DUF262 domain-containing protein [Algoriphagus marinus]
MNPPNTQIESGERLSFYQLFAEKKLTIEIPIIQRDYAQGRNTSKQVRERFLEALYDYLEDNVPGRDLDFIYGSISNIGGNEIFIPLDGQQRLTTLFLLHWYLAALTDRKDELKAHLATNVKSKFTYETRSSAREFCDALMIKDLTKENDIEDHKLSDIIQNESWFFLSWKNDPTIQSMLVMLDAIERKFKGKIDHFDKLINLTQPIITFQFLDLKEFLLTDDLYIKMNSRGKPLTPFENFKAKLEQKIEELFKDDSELFELKIKDHTRSVKAHEYFSKKVDTVWLNYFWEFGGRNPKAVDEQIMSFIRVIFANYIAIRDYDKISGESIQRPYNFRVLIDSQDIRKKRDTENLSFFDFLELGAISKESIQYLIKAFIRLTEIDSDIIKKHIDPFHYNYDSILKKVLSNSLTAQERVKFSAFIGYIIQNGDQLDGLRQWMRVTHNLAENHRIDDADILISSLQGINQMAIHSHSILNKLRSKKFVIGGFYGRQIEEERIKARLILWRDHWEKEIHSIEQTSFFNGQIGFLLDFCGIIEEFLRPGDFDWDDSEDQEYLDKFSNYSKKAVAIFSEIGSAINQDFLWERAVLTKGNYLLSTTYNRLNFLQSTVNIRDNSWKRLLRLNPESQSDDTLVSDKRNFVKDVFDDPRFDANDAWGSCNQIIKDEADNWRKYFITNPRLIRVCEHGFIRFDDDLNIKLQTKTKLTYYCELRTYNLYTLVIVDKSFPPFNDSKYNWLYGNEEGICSIFFGPWTYQRKEYELRIYFESSYGFGIQFTKSKGDRSESQYDDDLVKILKNQGYQFDLEEWNSFYITDFTESGIVKKLNNLCLHLNKLS